MYLPDASLDEWVASHKHLHRRRTRTEGLSYTQALTKRNNDMLAGGRHPATGVALREPRDKTCGGCAHLISHSHDRTWYKCNLVPITFGAKTDVRRRWPACVKWERATEEQRDYYTR